jgi:hypothetical protein
MHVWVERDKGLKVRIELLHVRVKKHSRRNEPRHRFTHHVMITSIATSSSTATTTLLGRSRRFNRFALGTSCRRRRLRFSSENDEHLCGEITRQHARGRGKGGDVTQKVSTNSVSAHLHLPHFMFAGKRC